MDQLQTRRPRTASPPSSLRHKQSCHYRHSHTGASIGPRPSNVLQNLSLQGITWPVAMDNQNSLWEAYGIEYWPTQMIFDRNGTLRKTIIGEGHDDEVSAIVQSLIDS